MLPLPAFGAAVHLRLATGFIPVPGKVRETDPHAYFGLLLLALLAGSVAVEHFDLSRLDHLFPFRDAGKERLRG